MQDLQYSNSLQRPFDHPIQTSHNLSSNTSTSSSSGSISATQMNPQFICFNESGYLNDSVSYSPSSLHPAGFMHSESYHKPQTRPHPPPLQTRNLSNNGAYEVVSPYSYYASLESPCAQISTPMTPAPSSFYINAHASDSLTTFSPSSDTSVESNYSVEETSPTSTDHPFDDLSSNGFSADNDTPSIRPEPEQKRRNSRRMWTHSLEKYIFTPHEIATLGTPHRRTIYSASLEAHIDRLHSQLLGIGYFPVNVEDLQMYRGLNCKIAKGMVAGLQHDFVQVRTRLLEIERAMNNAREIASIRVNHERIEAQSEGLTQDYGTRQQRNHSLNSPLSYDPIIGHELN